MGAPQLIVPGTASGTAPVGGSGTSSPSTIPRWTGATTLGDSVITQEANARAIGVATAANPWNAALRAIDLRTNSLWNYNSGNDANAYWTVNAYLDTAGNLVYKASAAASEYRQTAGQHIWHRAAAGVAGAGCALSESARIDSSGNIILNAANTGATIQAAGSQQGLKLHATPGNGDVQTLDCYQENYASNSWVPVIYGGTTAGTATYSVQEGFYTRWGNLIFCTATVVFSGHTGTGNLSISGLPFAAKTANSGTYRSAIIIEEGGGVKAILRLQSGTTASTTGVSVPASGNYVITFVYATN